MSFQLYSEKINEYVASKEKTATRAPSKGLLAPSKKDKTMSQQQRDAVTVIGDFVYALRQKRKEIKGTDNAA